MPAFVKITERNSAELAPDFDTPLAMLKACHRRVEAQCSTLQRLVAHTESHGADLAAQQAAAGVMRYFDQAAPKHHADEEENLFPALLESIAGSDAVCLHEIFARLRADHDGFERRWASIRAQLQQVIAGQAIKLDALEIQDFAERYAKHIALEEGELLPMAERLLSDEAVAAIGRSMRERRRETAASGTTSA